MAESPPHATVSNSLVVPDEHEVAPPIDRHNAHQARLSAVDLAQRAGADAAEVKKAQDRLELLSQKAAVALESYREATAKLDAAQAARWEALERLDLAEQTLKKSQADIGRWANTTYQTGANTLEVSALLSMMLDDDPTANSAAHLAIGKVSYTKSEVLDTARRAEADHVAAAEEATVAQRQAHEFARDAEELKKKRDAAVAEQQHVVGELTAILNASRDAAEVAAEKASQLEAAVRFAEQQSRSGHRDESNIVTGSVGDCRGQIDLSGYPNGNIPVDALCPIWGTKNQRLRADAAYAFNQMSQKYAEEFGRPICVTDSYRTYEEQVSLKKRKPHLAAAPGTSNHGWGRALDLCAGIQYFTTAQHQWMQWNAGTFGWFHPSWAQRTGSKPEAWHWEYSG